MKCDWCGINVGLFRFIQHKFGYRDRVCQDCYEDYQDSLPECEVCGYHTKSDKVCAQCGKPLCFSCWDDCGLFCSAECLWIAQREAEADSRYDLMREMA